MLRALLGLAVDGGRRIQVQLLPGAGAGHIHQAALLFEVLGARQSVARREAVLHQIDDQHGVPLQALGRVHRGKGYAAFVVLVFLVGGIQGQIGQEQIQIVIARGHLQDLFQPLLAAGPVFGIAALQHGPVMVHDELQRRHRMQRAGAHLGDEAQILAEGGEAGAGLVQGRAVGALGHVVELEHGLGADALVQLGHAREGGHVQRVEQQAGVGHDVLDVGRLGVAQAAVLAEGDARLVEGHFQMVGMETRPEEHGNLVRQVAGQQILDAAHHQLGLAHVAEGRHQTYRRAALLAGEQFFAEGFRGVFQQVVGHVQDGLGGAVVLLQPDDAGPGEKLGKIEDVAHIGATEGIDGLGLVAHGHDVAGRHAFALRPGQQAHDAGLHQVGVLIFIHQDMRVATAQVLGRALVGAQQVLQLEQQVVVIQQALFLAVGIVGLAQLHQRFGIGQQVEGLALQDLVQAHLLVPGLAQKAHDGLGAREGTVALAQPEVVLAGLDRRVDVRAVHDREGAVLQPVGTVTAQHAEREGVEGAPLHQAQGVVGQGRGPLQHLLRRLAGEGEQQHGFRRDAVIRQPGQAVGDGAGLAGTGAGHYQDRPVAAGGGLVLGAVERVRVINHRYRLA